MIHLCYERVRCISIDQIQILPNRYIIFHIPWHISYIRYWSSTQSIINRPSRIYAWSFVLASNSTINFHITITTFIYRWDSCSTFPANRTVSLDRIISSEKIIKMYYIVTGSLNNFSFRTVETFVYFYSVIYCHIL